MRLSQTSIVAVLVIPALMAGCRERRPSHHIYDAIERKDYRESEVRDMIIADPSLLSAKDEYSRTPLYMLSSRGRTSMVEFCLNKGADVNQPGFDGHTALSAACHSGEFQTAVLLLSRGADPNVMAEDGEYPLHQIIEVCPEEFNLFRLLVEKGASLDIKTRDGRSLLEFCRDRRLQYERPDYPGSKSLQKRLVDAYHRLERYIESITKPDDAPRFKSEVQRQ